ncbi:sirohydrochlorin chelatase [Aneurinibacillus terranovensis]|uniref:sirohydrochlorin chelatase n=1 Tax=Aneurinibacillus terranovensis TaxID=278991 RepID=UPI0003F87956|nr:sirohydrochlorin chelatase [Aneurinibacillus terranovensis]
MKAVLFVGHGSKDPQGNAEILAFVEKFKGELDVPIIETCFLEFAHPGINEGIDNCLKQGAAEVVVIPMMLFPAGHSKIHIPAAIDHARAHYPHVSFTYGRPIGIHDGVFSILEARLNEAGFNTEEESGDTAILIVGRGSSDPDANGDVYKLSRLLWERLHVRWVETCFIGVTAPSVEEGIERCLALGAKRVVLVPYLLFTGILMKRMEEKLVTFRSAYPDRAFVMTEYLGFHPALHEIFLERAREALQDEVKMNCDTCQYRLFAVKQLNLHHDHDHDHGHYHHDHGHHHHHGDHHDDHAHELHHEHDHHHSHQDPERSGDAKEKETV